MVSKRWRDYASTEELWRPLATSRWPSTLALQEKGLDRFVLSGRFKHNCLLAGDRAYLLMHGLELQTSQFAFLVDICAAGIPVLNGLFGVESHDSQTQVGLQVVIPHGAGRLAVPLDVELQEV